MDKATKSRELDGLRDRFHRMVVAVLADYRGMKVKEANHLRDACREASVELRVVKNTFLRVVTKDTGYQDVIRPHIAGMTAVAWSYEDPIAPARVLVDYARKNPKIRVKCALLEGKVLEEQEVKALSAMPGKDQLRAQLLATFQAPATQFVRTLNAAAQDFEWLLDARRRSMEGSG